MNRANFFDEKIRFVPKNIYFCVKMREVRSENTFFCRKIWIYKKNVVLLRVFWYIEKLGRKK